MAHQSVPHHESDDDRCNQENKTADSKVDALSAVALILLAVVVAVYWVSGQ